MRDNPEPSSYHIYLRKYTMDKYEKIKELLEGNECGLTVESKTEIAPGDYLEAFKTVIK